MRLAVGSFAVLGLVFLALPVLSEDEVADPAAYSDVDDWLNGPESDGEGHTGRLVVVDIPIHSFHRAAVQITLKSASSKPPLDPALIGKSVRLDVEGNSPTICSFAPPVAPDFRGTLHFVIEVFDGARHVVTRAIPVQADEDNYTSQPVVVGF